jgi:hypothetical protein
MVSLKKEVLVVGGSNEMYSANTSLEGFLFSKMDSVSSTNTMVYIFIDETYNEVKRFTPQYWDLFNNAWGIVLLAFQLVIFRVSRLINLKVKASQVSEEKDHKRRDLLGVLFDIDRLSKGVYKEELSSVGFYYKSKLPDDNL